MEDLGRAVWAATHARVRVVSVSVVFQPAESMHIIVTLVHRRLKPSQVSVCLDGLHLPTQIRRFSIS